MRLSLTLYLDAVVPLRRVTGFFETMLDRVENPSRIGAALQGKSIRTISDVEFGAIVRAGLRQTLDPENAVRLGAGDPGHAHADVVALVNVPTEEQERRNRPDTGQSQSSRCRLSARRL